jgi:hypothetical protein
LDYCRLEDHLVAGQHFILKTESMKPIKRLINESDEEDSFTDYAFFFSVKMYHIHATEKSTDRLKLANQRMVIYLLIWLWIKLVAQNIADSVYVVRSIVHPHQNHGCMDLQVYTWAL